MLLSGFDVNKDGVYRVSGAPAGHDARVLSEIAARLHGCTLLHVATDDVRAAVLSETLAFFAPQVEVLSLPAWDCLPYDRVSPQAEIVSQRIATLNAIVKDAKSPRIILTTVNTIVQRTLPPDVLSHACLGAAVGDTLPMDKLRRYLATNGYTSSSTVREPGEFAVRGGIVDLFPPGYTNPIRLDFFGDEIESIRSFDALSQTTTEKITAFYLGPVSEALFDENAVAHFRSRYRELFGAVTESDPLYDAISAGAKFPGVEHWLGLFYPRLYSVFDYLPSAAISYDYQAADAIKSRLQQVEDFYQARASLYQSAKRGKNGKDRASIIYKPAPVESLYLAESEINAAEKGRVVLHLSPFTEGEGEALSAHGKRGRNFSDARAQGADTHYAAIKNYCAEHQGENRRVVVACYSQGSADRMATLLRNHGLAPSSTCATWKAAHGTDIKLIPLVILGLENGFVSPDLAVVTEQDILGDRLQHAPKKRRNAAQFQIELGSLNPGDFVVHAEHGIGRYEGLVAVTVLNTTHDCVKLIYDGGDKLFVPVENLDLLTRYSTAETGAVLDKLGGAGWQGRKARVKKRLKDMAEALMKIAAEREVRRGEVIAINEGAYQEFASRFPYSETDDQLRSIENVFDDMASGKPMDRLVCGDVGFGKTEVALRAAFAAVQAGLQVAVVVPTTLLARQHFNNFVNRFNGFPVRVAQLSRMVSAHEQKAAKEGIKDGSVQIVVGTHALLSSDIAFNNLGLLIVDEEQHFGVKQKERLKQLRADIHVLTLTATPIPRTLQMALSGVRELSLIATPPLDRLAVRTFVLPYDPLVIRDAMMREHFRGGQCFYVCPRIEDLTLVAEELRQLVPEVKIVTAHGRMAPTQLDDIMTAFDAREFDVLLATNIIESGLDIPNANTMIIHRADMFGLAQLYQLRGRVGRGKTRGYAYLTYAPMAVLSETAQKRLEVIETLDQLGAGFQLASHDMDIRGAGNLLGEEQSGHIREVGVELYQQMLEDAVEAARLGLKAEDEGDERWTPTINLGLSVLIPEDFVKDLNIRLGLYRRLADINVHEDDSAIEAIAAEMIDRFGPLPTEVENLLQTVAIKQFCRRAGIEKIDAGPKGAVLTFRKNRFAKPDRLIAWIGQQAGTAKVSPDQKLILMRTWGDVSVRLEATRKVMTELADLAA